MRELHIDWQSEIIEHNWFRPHEAINLRDAGEIELAPPTWVTLNRLISFANVEDALNEAINYNFSKIKNLLEVLSFPYKRNKNTNYFQLYNGKKNEKYVTFCGT